MIGARGGGTTAVLPFCGGYCWWDNERDTCNWEQVNKTLTCNGCDKMAIVATCECVLAAARISQSAGHVTFSLQHISPDTSRSCLSTRE